MVLSRLASAGLVGIEPLPGSGPLEERLAATVLADDQGPSVSVIRANRSDQCHPWSIATSEAILPKA